MAVRFSRLSASAAGRLSVARIPCEPVIVSRQTTGIRGQSVPEDGDFAMSCKVLLLLTLALLTLYVGIQADPAPILQSPVVYDPPQEAKTTAVADFNGDGRDDVAVAAWPSALYVFYQQADGSLGSPVEFYAPVMPLAIAAGDINGDGRADLAVGGNDGAILLYYQQSDGALGLPDTCWGYGEVNSLAIDDFNGDGLADIADTSAIFPIVLVSLQASDGSFGLPAPIMLSGSNVRSICSLDYNSDGARDLACLVDGSVCYLAGSAIGAFAPPVYLPATWAYALAAGDVTGDGRDDLVFTVPDSIGYGTVTVYPQGQDGQPAVPQFYPADAYAQALALADLNADGRTDVAAVHSGYEAASVLLQTPEGALGSWMPYSVPCSNNYQCGALAIGDLNSDGAPDLAIADPWNGLVVLPHVEATPLPST